MGTSYRKLDLPAHRLHTGPLILVGKEYPFVSACPALAPAKEGDPQVFMERIAATLLNRLMSKIDGWASMLPVSGYRSFAEQQTLFRQSLAENGLAFTMDYVARPGYSEHHTGYAIDLGLASEQVDFIRPHFPQSGICQKFRTLAPEYGFIERYPEGKTAVTGIAYEPWHFRYVGLPHARIITDKGFALEEYIAFLRDYPHGKRPLTYMEKNMRAQISYLPAVNQGVDQVQIRADRPYAVSGNNIDGFILTEWRTLDED